MSVAIATPQPAHEHSSAVRDALRRANPHASGEMSQFAHCLTPLLAAIHWRGDPRRLAEALPHFVSDLDLADLRNVLARIGYKTNALSARLRDLDPRLTPCLFVGDDGRALVVLDCGPEIRAFDPRAGVVRRLKRDPGPGTAYLIEPVRISRIQAQHESSDWFADLARRFKPLMLHALLLTFFMNSLMVVAPLSIMAIYDQVVGKNAPNTLSFLIIGVAGAFVFELGFRALRGRVQAHIAARMEYLIGAGAFERVLKLPPGFTENAPLGSQISRLREFESLRDFFSSPLAALVMDLPFVLLFVAIIAAIAGPVAWVPVALILVFVVIGVVLFPVMKRRVLESSRIRSERQIFQVEALSNMRAVKEHAAEATWMERFRELSAESAMASFRASVVSATAQNLAQMVMMAAGVSAFTVGVVQIMEGRMSTGALIAAMALIWRVLSPIQTGFMLVNRLEQIVISVRLLNTLMRHREEGGQTRAVDQRRVFRGALKMTRVSLRYPNQVEPALLNISLQVKPGEIVAVVGASGSGKSTLLRAILALATPQGGKIELDGVDLRQIDPIELRQAIGFVPQYPTKFYGTIAQNLRLSVPTASLEDLREACVAAGVIDEIEALEKGFDTRLSDRAEQRFSAGFQQQLALARAYLRKPAIYLLDEASSVLDFAADRAFMAAVERQRGRATVIMTTHRPSHMKLADTLIYMDHGMIQLAGPPAETLPKIPMGMM